jgi:hypothetical protein
MQRCLLVIAILLVPAHLQAGEKSQATLRSPIGTVLQKSAEKGWLAPMLNDVIPKGNQLIALPGARGILDIHGGDLRLMMAGNLPEISATPVLESVLTLNDPAPGVDLDFTLDRGRVLIQNHKANGAAQVRARIQGKTLAWELLDKDTVVALELFSRWPAGSPFVKKPKADHQPVGELIFMVVSGKATIELNGQKQTIQGPVMYQFNTQRGMEGPLPLKETPAWINPAIDQPEKVMKAQSAVEKLRRAGVDQGVVAALAKASRSSESSVRALAAYTGTALDNPAAGIAALKDGKAKEVRGAGVGSLIHYIGRGNAEDVRLYETLLGDKIKAGQAGIIMELLHGLSEEARQRPETYDTLISYLQSDQIAIRELAAVNLNALVPQGRSIAFDAAATSEQRAQAQAAWRKLIPEGQVPKK